MASTRATNLAVGSAFAGAGLIGCVYVLLFLGFWGLIFAALWKFVFGG